MSTTMTMTESETKPQTAPAPTQQEEEPYKYAHLMQTWSTEKQPPLKPFDIVDRGTFALKHANPRSFLEKEGVEVVEMTPEFGTEVRGMNLATLTNEEKDQLALEVGRRGVVVCRGQEDFIDRGPAFYREWGSYFGPLHTHPLAGHPEGYPDVHLVYKDANSRFNLQQSITTTVWHSDCSFEIQPAGLTAFWLLSAPPTGGDTLYSSQVLNFKSLSPTMQDFLRTLKAVHTAHGTMRSKGGGILRRENIDTIHPVVRRHPATGEEAIYVNKQMTKSIVGMKKEESDLILNFLFDHVARSTDHQIRAKHAPYTVVIWDNRITCHSATSDYGHLKSRRHGARVSAQAERPVPAWDGLKMD
ncbi:Alpha-ketoglutarate-dependent sulfonate dioxygenase [Mycena kentingensis (nom. inval.)]|nr:Alpha-ketoglutarate-dependent sulfonate dioxygenase [Mycena kentingensis (nom. inval.)]